MERLLALSETDKETYGNQNGAGEEGGKRTALSPSCVDAYTSN